ncbi:50S ribosomal protein L33 [Porphyridium purpureum]|uniref:50S ribosomal protein L33 n=1 Tax=Porphyridium purpureum TaxID=35688 RepID=A0A5J4Z3H2_PORPP|nr:50S ribosomal protein L33 [Porphyridium purpureum]|eukprot:POR0684..scf295_1
MAPKRKTFLVKLVSLAGTGYSYVARRNPKNVPQKLKLMKHDPIVNKHVLFVEQKLRYITCFPSGQNELSGLKDHCYVHLCKQDAAQRLHFMLLMGLSRKDAVPAAEIIVCAHQPWMKECMRQVMEKKIM